MDDTKVPAGPLHYETTPRGVTRRQMSFLLLLVTVDSIALILYFCVPTLSPMIKQSWADYQARSAQRKQQALQRTKLETCMKYSQLPTQVVYAESLEESQKLMSGSATAMECDDRPAVRGDSTPTKLVDALFASGWRQPALI